MSAEPGLSPLGELRQAVAEGLARPRHEWEALVIVLALGLAVLAARALARWYGGRVPVLAGVDAQAARRTLHRVLFPLLGLALIGLGEMLLRAAHVVSSAADARLLRLAASLTGTLAVVRVLFVLLRRVLRRSPLVARFERLIGIAAALVVALYATGVLGDVVDWLAGTQIPLGTTASVSLWSILLGSVTMLSALLAAMWLGSLIDERLSAEQGLDPNLRTVLGRVVRAVLLVLAVLLALGLSGIDLTVLSVFGGALGVGLGLGLQRIASNYVSGFILLLDHSLRIGDVVTVDKYSGQVIKISTRYTVLRASDGSEAVVPNEMLVSSPVVNSTLSDPRLSLSVAVAIGPQADLDQAMQLMLDAARAPERVLAEPPAVVLLKEFQGGNVLLEVSFWIGDPERGRQNVQSEVAVGIYRGFAAHGITLAAPRTDLSLAGAIGALQKES